MTTTKTEYIVTAHLPRPDQADRFTGPDALPSVDWTIGTLAYCTAKLRNWERYYASTTVRPVGPVTEYGAR